MYVYITYIYIYKNDSTLYMDVQRFLRVEQFRVSDVKLNSSTCLECEFRM